MSNFDTWWAFCMRPENDGNANDASPGELNACRWGWTYPTWIAARSWAGDPDISPAAFNAATQGQMGILAQAYFWDRQGGTLMPRGVDLVAIDWVWTSGGAAYEIQKMVGAEPDGIIGPKTVAAMAQMGSPEMVAESVYNCRVAYYDDIGLRYRYPGLYRRADQTLQIAMGLMDPGDGGKPGDGFDAAPGDGGVKI